MKPLWILSLIGALLLLDPLYRRSTGRQLNPSAPWNLALLLAIVCGAAATFCFGLAWHVARAEASLPLAAWYIWTWVGVLFALLALLRAALDAWQVRKSRTHSRALVVWQPPVHSGWSAASRRRVAMRTVGFACLFLCCWLTARYLTWTGLPERMASTLPASRAMPTPTPRETVPGLSTFLGLSPGPAAVSAPAVSPEDALLDTYIARHDAFVERMERSQPTQPAPPVRPIGGPVPTANPLSAVPFVSATVDTLDTTSDTTDATTPLDTRGGQIGEPYVVVQALLGANLRADPHTKAAILATAPLETRLDVVSQTADSEWIQVRLETGTLAWIFADLTGGIRNEQTKNQDKSSTIIDKANGK